MRKTGEAFFDLSLRVVDAIIPLEGYGDLTAKGDPTEPLKFRHIAISEGKHNGDRFSADELKKMVEDALTLKQSEGREKFAAPVVVDHSYSFLDKMGATIGLSFEEEVKVGNKTVKNAVVSDIELWRDTPREQEVATKVLRDPENTCFSVRIRGMLHYDHSNDEYFWSDLRLIHNSIVNEPADQNARLIEELSHKDAPAADFPLYSVSENSAGMGTEDFEKRLARVEAENADLKKQLDAQKAPPAPAENVLERATALAEIFRLDPDVNREFVSGLSKEQLVAYRADLERRAPAGDNSGKGKAPEGGAQLSAEDRAKRLMGTG